MPVTVSVVRSSEPRRLTAAAQSLQHAIAEVENAIGDHEGLLGVLSDIWRGETGQAVFDKGRSVVLAHQAFRDRLESTQQALHRGGADLSELREQIISTAVQATKLGGAVGDDGSVTCRVAGQLLTPPITTAYSAILKMLLTAFAAADEATAASLRGDRSDQDVRLTNFTQGGGIPEAPPNLDTMASERRHNHVEAFRAVFEREPASTTDWQTAEALDPQSYNDKYDGRPPSIVAGRIQPVPGQGSIKTGLFIPRDEVFNLPRNDLGDNRGFDPSFAPEDTRVSMYVDYENGLVIARQNPSVDVDGNVAVLAPDVKVQQTADGAVRIQYEAANGFAPIGSDLSGHVVRGDVVFAPGSGNEPAAVDGIIGDYPSLEIYQTMPDGSSHILAQDPADSGNVYGPLTELPFSHEIGRGSAVFEPFESNTPQLPGGPRYPGDVVPYVPGQIDPNSPTDLRPVNEAPTVVVVR